MTLEQLRARNAEIQAAVDALITSAESAEGGLSDEQMAQVTALNAEYTANNRKIDALTVQASMRAGATASAGRASQSSQPGQQARIEVLGEAGDRDPQRGYRSVAEFAREVMHACRPGSAAPPRLQALLGENVRGSVYAAPSGYNQEAVGTDGGFIIPPMYRDGIWEGVYNDENNNLINLVFRETSNQNTVVWNADESTPYGATGVKAYWMDEAGAYTKSKPVIDPRSVKLHKMGVLVLATDEMLADGPLLESRITRGAARAISWLGSEAIFRGDGVAKPLGILSAACTVEQAKVSGQAADTVVARNVLEMWARRQMQPDSRFVWLHNQDVEPQFGLMTIGDQPMYMPEGGLTNLPVPRLQGKPCLATDHADTLGDVGDLVLADVNGYYLVTHASGIKEAQSMHLYFDYDVMAFRFSFRLGGQPFLKSAVTPAFSSNTRSSFVTLAARA